MCKCVVVVVRLKSGVVILVVKWYMKENIVRSTVENKNGLSDVCREGVSLCVFIYIGNGGRAGGVTEWRGVK